MRAGVSQPGKNQGGFSIFAWREVDGPFGSMDYTARDASPACPKTQPLNSWATDLRLKDGVVTSRYRAGAVTHWSKSGTRVPCSSSYAIIRGAAHGDPHAPGGGLNQHAVEAKARGPRQIRRGPALMREPARPVSSPFDVVQQRPGKQIVRLSRPSARLQENRAANRTQALFEQCLGLQRRPDLIGVGQPDVHTPPDQVDLAVVGFQLDGDIRVDRLETGEPRYQALLGQGLDRDDHKTIGLGTTALAFANVVQFGEDSLDRLQVLLAVPVEFDAAGVAHEQGSAEILFQVLSS